MCFLTKCPYVPPHEFNIDFPHLMLRYGVAERNKGKTKLVDDQLTKTDRNGKFFSKFSNLANWSTKTSNKLTRPIMEMLLKIDKEAELPKFYKRTLIDQAKKIKALEEQLLYTKADSENNRKRSLEEAEKTRKFAIESFSQEILLVKDSLDSALTIENASLESYKNGVELTVKQLSTIFEKFNIEEIDPVGENFDPNFHQAMTMLDSEEEPNKIISVFQKGYKLNGRVLRPALVSVSKEKETSESVQNNTTNAPVDSRTSKKK